MKRFIFVLIVIILVLTSCSVLDNTKINGDRDKTEYSNTSNSSNIYIVNKTSLVYHKSFCSYASRISIEDRWECNDIKTLEAKGYKRCSVCLR